MKKRSEHTLNFPDFFEKFSFQALALDFSDKENNMYLQNHSYYKSTPVKASPPSIDTLVNSVFDDQEDSTLFSKLMP